MLEEVCAGVRIFMFLTMTLVHMRERVPYSIDSQPKLVPATDATRYALGQIWWFENRDDIADMSTKILACELNAVNATRFTRRLGCFIQRTKLRIRRKMTNFVKNAAQFTLKKCINLQDALTGPRALPVFLKLMLTLSIVALGIAQLVYNYQFLYDTTKFYGELLINYYFPREPEPAKPRLAVYVSDEAREAITQANEAAAAAAAEAANEDIEEPVEEVDAEGSPRTGDGAPGAHGGGPDEPMEATTPARNSPRRQQMQQGDDNVGALDNAATRVMSASRAGAAEGTQDGREADMGASEAAEPLAKKRVAFKDDLVDGAETGDRNGPLAPRRPFGASPLEDPAPTPTTTPAAPRSNRFGARGRPGGVGTAGRRPLAR